MLIGTTVQFWKLEKKIVRTSGMTEIGETPATIGISRKKTTATERVSEGLPDQWTASESQEWTKKTAAMEGSLPEMDSSRDLLLVTSLFTYFHVMGAFS